MGSASPAPRDARSTATPEPVHGGLPFVSIVVPARNEERFIAQCLDSLIGMEYPRSRLEILVVDGASEDATPRIVAEYAGRDPIVRLISNPGQTTPVAMNRGIAAATGEVILRIDAHARYPSNYLAILVAALDEHDADVVGSVMITRPRAPTAMGRAIVAALTTPFGVGNTHFRLGTDRPRDVDSVFGGAYRRAILDRVGEFNERLPFSQDIELNLRIKKLGGRILLVPTVTCEYFARSDMRSFTRHNYRNGLWAILPFLYSPIMPVGWKHLIPLAFVGSLLLTGLLALLVPSIGVAVLIGYVTLYLSAAIVASVASAVRHRDAVLAFVLPGVFLSLHVMYGIGSLVGVVRAIGVLARRATRGHKVPDGGARPRPGVE